MKKTVISVLLLFLLIANGCEYSSQGLVPTENNNELPIVEITTTSTAEYDLTSPPTTPTTTPTTTATITQTVTPIIIFVTILQDTNCRSGAASTFPLITVIKSNTDVEVIGKNPAGDYFYIRNPANFQDYCWIWNQYTNLETVTSTLAILTPQPTPIVKISTSTPITENKTNTSSKNCHPGIPAVWENGEPYADPPGSSWICIDAFEYDDCGNLLRWVGRECGGD